MAQNITLNIAGKKLSLVATNEDMEQMMRVAAEQLNELLKSYDAKWPDKPLEDKLVFALLNESVLKQISLKKAKTIAEEVKEAEAKTSAYLEGKI